MSLYHDSWLVTWAKVAMTNGAPIDLERTSRNRCITRDAALLARAAPILRAPTRSESSRRSIIVRRVRGNRHDWETTRFRGAIERVSLRDRSVTEDLRIFSPAV